MTLADEIRLLMAAPSMTTNDACTLLRRDHDEIMKLARDLAECESGDERRALLKLLRPALFAYTRAESREIYDVLLRGRHGEEVRELAHRAYAAHGAVDALVGQMTRSRKTESEEWRERAHALLALVTQHVEKEQTRLFELMSEHYNDDERKTIGRRFVAAKSRLALGGKSAWGRQPSTSEVGD
jgi:hypothetical protein